MPKVYDLSLRYKGASFGMVWEVTISSCFCYCFWWRLTDLVRDVVKKLNAFALASLLAEPLTFSAEGVGGFKLGRGGC